jgi:hypothetical protein
MILITFLNKYDKRSYLLGRKLTDYLKGDYIKVYSREKDTEHDQCEVRDTLSKIKEYAQVFDKVLVSFGLRLFPPSAYKDIVKRCNKINKSTVFLKVLRGSKTWSIHKGNLSFDNQRIADTGIFILKAEDIEKAKTDNFNTFIKNLVKKNKLKYQMVPYWILTNKKKRRGNKKRRSK